jgi:glutaconate CoA-transferase subunit B
MAEYNKMELMICVASRFLEDGKLVAVGTGAPCAAAMVAQELHAPGLMLFFEAGGFAPLLPSRSRWAIRDALPPGRRRSHGRRRGVDRLRGAQIDMFGNLNSTLIGGDYDHPKTRLPGSGGANDFASYAWRTLVITPQDKRRFVKKLDFLTTPGFLTGKGARELAGLPAHCGPYKIITDLAVLGFDEDTCRMRLESVHPRVTPEEVRANTDFELLETTPITETPPPSKEELYILREKVDPHRYLIGRGRS